METLDRGNRARSYRLEPLSAMQQGVRGNRKCKPLLQPGNAYLDYFRNVYATYAAMAVRRHAKPHRDAISLAGLLRDLADNPTILSRSRLRTLFEEPSPLVGIVYPPDIARFLADSTYQTFADASGKHLDVQRIEMQLASLDDATKDVVELVDREIAHHDPRRSSGVATFAQLDGAIEMVTALTSDYSRLLTGRANLSMVPLDMTHALDVFKMPWIDKNNPPKVDAADI